MTPLARAIILIVLGFAFAVGAYIGGVFDPYLNAPPTAVATAPRTGVDDANSGDAASRKQARVNAGDEDGSGGAEAEKPTDQVQDTEVVAPTFDIVRVEEDGSMVVAGRAAPDALVEIIDGSTALGSATAGPTGDFAVVLDEPLDPGDYQIVLRATTPDNVAATSVETAIVTVPDSDAGEVLALVDRPGAPSRLITVPKGAREIRQDSQTPDAQAQTPAASSTGKTEAGVAQGEEPARARPAEEEKTGAVAEALPQQDDAAVSAARDGAAEQATGNETSAQAGEEVASRQTPAAEVKAPAASDDPARDPTAPFIEAVEIDGRSIFIAGTAQAGSRVRAYANDLLLGETETSTNGRFLIEALRDLPVGDYIVRVDQLMRDGKTVAARAAVPFTREAGEQVAAVARPEQAPANGANGEGKPEATAAGQAETGGDVPAEATGEQAAADDPAAGDGSGNGQVASSGEGDVTAPKLEPVEGSVIIRRGDTLWHISRRVYGHGIRYTTLYLANQDQIHDPDLIWPGQVFTVPETTQEGEPADLDAIGEQLLRPETQP